VTFCHKNNSLAAAETYTSVLKRFRTAQNAPFHQAVMEVRCIAAVDGTLRRRHFVMGEY
jgi:hypothetical protein